MTCFRCGGFLKTDEEDIVCIQCGLRWFARRERGGLQEYKRRHEAEETCMGRPRKFEVGDQVTLGKMRPTARHVGHIGTVVAFPRRGSNLYNVACICGEDRLWTAGQLDFVSRGSPETPESALPKWAPRTWQG